jgi:hypothetical protein
MPEFVEAVVKATNKKQRIPAAWLDHPVLSEPFRLTKRSEKAAAEEKPEKG